MTDRDTGLLLRAALQHRADYGMQTTDTDRELERLQQELPAARRHRQVRAVLAAAAAVAVIGGGVGVGIALRSGGHTSAPPIGTPSPTTLPAGTLPPGFPLGTFQHPGAGGLTTLKLAQNAQASVNDPRGTSFNDLTFTTPDVVTFDTKGGAGCTTPGRYHWSIRNDELVLTAISDSCFDRRIALTESPWGPVRRTSAP